MTKPPTDKLRCLQCHKLLENVPYPGRPINLRGLRSTTTVPRVEVRQFGRCDECLSGSNAA